MTMPQRLPPLVALRAFEAAARHLSFKRAAVELHVTPAAISHQVKALEEHLGLPLFRRLTRALELTDAGRAMLPKLREGFDCLLAAVEQARPAAARALAVEVSPAFASRWLLPRLQRFSTAHPDIELRVVSSQQAIDRPDADRPGDVIDPEHAGAEVAIRFGSGRYPGLRSERLFDDMGYVAVCSPRLLAGAHPLHTPGDLRHHVLVHDDTIPDLAERPTWAEWLRQAGVTDVDDARGPHFSNSSLAVEAAIDGLGVALALSPLVSLEIAAGRLVSPFDVHLHTRFAYHLVMAEATAGRPAVQAFRTWLQEEARGEPSRL